MRNGSKAWMLRPVGRISGERIRSPPGTGAMIAARQRAHQGRQFGLLLQQIASMRARVSASVGHQREMLGARASAASGVPTTCRPSGISASFGFQQLQPQRVGIACRPVDGFGLFAISAASSARSWRIGRQLAPAGQAVLQLEQTLVETRSAPAAASDA